MDRRLIQTAVFGGPDSDEPALCPEDAAEFDAWQAAYGRDYWCGTRLEGGCGRRLVARKCTDKVCHFAHYPAAGEEAVACSRRVKGRDGSDHLFVKQAFALGLAANGISATYEYPEPVGSAVVIRCEDGRTILVHLDRTQPVPWNDPSLWQIVLGPGVPDGKRLEQRGYVHRIRIADEKSGSGRSVQFGTQKPHTGTYWDSLNKLLITDDGLAVAQPAAAAQPVPAVEAAPVVQVPRQTGPAAPSAAPAPAPQERTPAQRAVALLDSACSADDPQKVAAAVRSLQELLDAADEEDTRAALQAGLAQGQQWRDRRAHHRNEVLKLVQQQFTDNKQVGSSLTLAEALVQDDDATPEQRTAVRDLRAHFEQQATAWEQAQQQKAVQRAAESEVVARMNKVRPFVDRVCMVLVATARTGSICTWQELAELTDLRLLAFSESEKAELLVMVERGRTMRDPLRSTLLAVAGGPEELQLYRVVAKRLGRSVPTADKALLAELAGHRRRLYNQRSGPRSTSKRRTRGRR
ncbi:hypothetical protein [Streptacidiphilus sp. MAP5-52]|uniref:hypothetical protein n=1 Tax=Streptacidiphilus sp. MAP5-52 TaxID=3156267 RepID=UPI003512C3CE